MRCVALSSYKRRIYVVANDWYGSGRSIPNKAVLFKSFDFDEAERQAHSLTQELGEHTFLHAVEYSVVTYYIGSYNPPPRSRFDNRPVRCYACRQPMPGQWAKANEGCE